MEPLPMVEVVVAEVVAAVADAMPIIPTPKKGVVRIMVEEAKIKQILVISMEDVVSVEAVEKGKVPIMVMAMIMAIIKTRMITGFQRKYGSNLLLPREKPLNPYKAHRKHKLT